MKEALLILDDGSTFRGWSFGYEADAEGEVVFNTAMTGYPESLTDPSYAGQMLVMTYPLIGNYGVPPTGLAPNGLPVFMEGDRIFPSALIVADYSESYSHWNARESLAAWLRREHVPALTGIDTRRLTMRLRERGVMKGRIVLEGAAGAAGAAIILQHTGQDYGAVNWVERVSCKEVIIYPAEERVGRVVLVDCGVKANIIRCLLSRGLEVIRVPWDYDFNQLEFDGLFLANGPGDPSQCAQTVNHIRQFMANEIAKGNYSPPSQGKATGRRAQLGNGAGGGSIPCMGICLGNQLLARAAGARTYKLKYGHRSHNQPVRMVGTNRCFITSQNHGYAVDDATLPADWQPLFVNMNDGTNEGIRHVSRPWFSAQFHPEACSGPTDTEFLFDEFVKCIKFRTSALYV